MKISYLISPVLLTYGYLNVTSEYTNASGWLAVLVSSTVLIGQLISALKYRDIGTGDGTGGSSDVSYPNSKSDSDFSGGDGGGGD